MVLTSSLVNLTASITDPTEWRTWPLDLHDQRLNNGDRQRQLNGNDAALAGLRIDFHTPIDSPNVRSHDVHADTTA